MSRTRAYTHHDIDVTYFLPLAQLFFLMQLFFPDVIYFSLVQIFFFFWRDTFLFVLIPSFERNRVEEGGEVRSKLNPIVCFHYKCVAPFSPAMKCCGFLQKKHLNYNTILTMKFIFICH